MHDMQTLMYFADFFLHLDKHLDLLVTGYGVWAYAILFAIIFCETGLVVTPILPGDSLLFAAGALSARGSFDIFILVPLLLSAAILGNTLNYHIGYYFGARAFQPKYERIFKKKYLEKTQKFFDKYGGKTIIFAQFAPIVRTFSPFMAGVGKMSYSKFIAYNIIGAISWIGIFTIAGHFFSDLPVVKNNFTLVILAIIVVSLMPAIIEVIKSRRSSATT